jgi:TfoX/Sxy family transcriptional regulator of competence genes
MGTKGERSTALAGETAERFVQRLASIGGVSARKMFAGFGVFHDETMFAIVDSHGDVFLKSAEGGPEEEKHPRMPYYRISAEDLRSDAALVRRVRRALASAAPAGKAKKKG